MTLVRPKVGRAGTLVHMQAYADPAEVPA